MIRSKTAVQNFLKSKKQKVNRKGLVRAFLPFAICFLPFVTTAQTGTSGPVVVDRIVAVVGGQMVKQSEVENNIQQMKASGQPVDNDSRGHVLEELMYQKLLVSQAYRDSIKVTDNEVDEEMDKRMRYYLSQFGSVDEFEKYYGKSVEAYKLELKDKVKQLVLARKMNAKIIGDITVSPSEVKGYFNRIPKDSLPFINAELEVGQIVAKPAVTQELKDYRKTQLEEIRTRILKGTLDFCAAARAYSEDPGSKDNCGIYDGVRRGMFVPEFEAIAFKLKEGETSEVFETDFGYHFVQLLERRGDELKLRHILMVPPITEDALKASRQKLDSVLRLIQIDTLTFCTAAAKYSDDADTKYNCGLMINPQTGTSRIEADVLGQIDPTPGFALSLNDMKVGEITKPVLMVGRDGKQAYRLVWLKMRTEAHVANLNQDYQRIQDEALTDKQHKVVTEWIGRKLETTYIHIADDYKNCKFEYPWLVNMK